MLLVTDMMLEQLSLTLEQICAVYNAELPASTKTIRLNKKVGQLAVYAHELGGLPTNSEPLPLSSAFRAELEKYFLNEEFPKTGIIASTSRNVQVAAQRRAESPSGRQSG
jgi:hypothetical protein